MSIKSITLKLRCYRTVYSDRIRDQSSQGELCDPRLDSPSVRPCGISVEREIYEVVYVWESLEYEDRKLGIDKPAKA
jgi:hypothetical protein